MERWVEMYVCVCQRHRQIEWIKGNSEWENPRTIWNPGCGLRENKSAIAFVRMHAIAESRPCAFICVRWSVNCVSVCPLLIDLNPVHCVWLEDTDGACLIWNVHVPVSWRGSNHFYRTLNKQLKIGQMAINVTSTAQRVVLSIWCLDKIFNWLV